MLSTTLKVKHFNIAWGGLEDKVNDWLRENRVKVVDIKLSQSHLATDVLILYTEES